MTDNGGLKDTTRINHYRDRPDTVGDHGYAAGADDHRRNHLFVLAPQSRPYAGAVLALAAARAQRDAGRARHAGQARDSVQISVTVGPNLAAGTYSIRVKADTLSAVVETNETNNASTRTLAVTQAGGGNNPPVGGERQPRERPRR